MRVCAVPRRAFPAGTPRPALLLTLRPQDWPEDLPIWSLLISPLEDGDTDRDRAPALIEFLFAYPASYPEVAPLTRVRSEKGLSDGQIAALRALLDEKIDESLGMSMIYTLVSEAKEWLIDNAGKAAETNEEEQVR